MSASADQVAQNIANGMLEANPSIDVNKGPFYDFAIRPQATEIANAGAEAERISTLYSRMVVNPSSLTANEIKALGKAFKVAQPVGTTSKVLMTFWTSSMPVKEIIIPQGTSVATADGMYVFVTTRTVRGIDSSNASVFFDANSGRYLFSVPAESVVASSAYNLPARRITTLLGRIAGVSGVYNQAPSTGGSDPYQSDDYLSNIQDAFAARDTSTLGGFKVDMIRRGTSASFIVVTSSQRETFTRPVVGPAVDIYMNDPQENAMDEVISAAGKDHVIPSMQPVLTVATVSINGRQLDSSAWSVSFDNSIDYGRSSRAKTKIMLPATSMSDQVRISYTYAGSVQGLAQSLDDQDILGVDILPRLTRPVFINAQAYVACDAAVLAKVKLAISSYLTLPFNIRLSPDDAYDYIRTAFPEVNKLTWVNFSFLGSTGVGDLDIPVGYTPAFASSSDLQISLSRT
jgi:hypothetical protein